MSRPPVRHDMVKRDAVSHDTVEALVDRAQQELPYRNAAFTQLVTRFHPRVFRMAAHYLGNEADAEEATQETFVRVHHALPGFDHRATFTTWLYRIVYNVCATLYGKRKRRLEGRRDLAQRERGATQNVEAADSSSRVEQEIVNRALQRLNADDRALLGLRFVSELQVDEIAEVLEINQSAAKMRLARARERFKEAFLEEGGAQDHGSGDG